MLLTDIGRSHACQRDGAPGRAAGEVQAVGVSSGVSRVRHHRARGVERRVATLAQTVVDGARRCVHVAACTGTARLRAPVPNGPPVMTPQIRGRAGAEPETAGAHCRAATVVGSRAGKRKKSRSVFSRRCWHLFPDRLVSCQSRPHRQLGCECSSRPRR